MKRVGGYIAAVVLLMLMMNLIGLVSAIAPPEPPDEYEYRVYGYVKDSSTGSRIRSVTVKLYKVHNDLETYISTKSTDSSGYFSFLYISPTPLEFPDLFRIKLYHTDYDSLVKSKPANTNTNFGNIYMTNPVEKYAVVVGQTLGESGNDADLWVGKLRNAYAFPAGNIRKLKGDSGSYAATRSNIISALDWLERVTDPNDKIAFIFSGHGVRTSGNNGYFETSDRKQITDDELYSHLVSVRSDSIFVFISACYSGCFIDEFDSSPQRSKFFVTTSTDSQSASFGLTYLAFTTPINWHQYPGGAVVHEYTSWTWFFTCQLLSSNFLGVYTNARNSFRSWYNGKPHYEWVDKSEWISHTDWDWDTKVGPLEGYPQVMDGTAGGFYL
ncbi:MAG: caspase family protein [Candidatus Thorarchaeota archaeon]